MSKTESGHQDGELKTIAVEVLGQPFISKLHQYQAEAAKRLSELRTEGKIGGTRGQLPQEEISRLMQQFGLKDSLAIVDEGEND